MTPESLARMLEEFLAESREAVVAEDGGVIFELWRSRYSVSAEHGRCVLHLWSEERNTVRRVLDAEVRSGTLRLAVLRFGQARPSKLEICRERDRRTPAARSGARAAYQQLLGGVLEQQFPEFTLAQLTSAMDLERSFSPVYARGLLRRGRSAFAVFGVNGQETQNSIDASLTFGILWLDACRQAQAGALQVEGLKLFVPRGASEVVRERMAHLHHDAAKWQLYELDARQRSLEPIDSSDRGNLATRLLQCPSGAIQERFAEAIQRMRSILPQVEIAVLSPAEIGFRWRGLEFARARLVPQPATFCNREEIVFGVGGSETVLNENNAQLFRDLVRHLAQARDPQGPRHHPLWRMHPERWLESLVLRDITALDSFLDPTSVYSQVPAFAAAARAMIDVLACTREGRLVVLELKADEDIHLPLQGLDYWARVAWHHARGEFARFGYFPGRELSPQLPLLILVAPALHIHPATDTLLHYFSPEIEWSLRGIDEHWREGVKVIFRKRPQEAVDHQFRERASA